MKKRLLFLINILILFISALVFAQDYVVGEGDVLRIAVYDHDDLTTTARVSGEGVITFPLIGQIEVKGLTLAQIHRRSSLLSDGYVVNPQVNIFIQEFRSKKAFIMGEVRSPVFMSFRARPRLCPFCRKQEA